MSPATDLDAVRVPRDRAASYRRLGHWRPERLDELVLAHAGSDRCALVAGDQRLSYRDLAGAVNATAAGLRELGVRQGDRVLVQLPNEPELVILPLALMRIGALPVLAAPALREHELDRVVARAEPVAMAVPGRGRRFDPVGMAQELRARHPGLRLLLVSDGAESGEVDLTGLAARPGPVAESGGAGPSAADPAVLLLSSGTTGPPKIVVRTHEDYGCLIRAATEVAGVSAESVYLAVLPASHTFTLSNPGVLGTLAARGRVVLASPDDPRQALRAIEREGVTHSSLVPTVAAQWVAAARAGAAGTASLRVLQIGGAALDPALAREVRDVLGCRVQQVYGMSEGLVNMTRLDDPDDVVLNTQGRPLLDADEIRIEAGELLARGPYTVAGYYRDPESTAAAFTPDGFYRTGDLVRRHVSGNLVLTGRVKNLINRGGEKICAEELEGVVGQHPAVAAVAAIPAPHPVLGEVVCLFVVPRPASGADLGELRRFLAGRGLARYKLPERLELLDALPVIGVGKIDRRALRRRAEALVTA